MAKRLLDEDLRQANKSTSPLKTQAFKLANGTRYKSTAADGQAGKFAANNPAYPAGYMNPNLRPQNVAGNNVVPLPAGPSFTANTNTRVKLGNGQIVSMPANTTMNFTQQPTMNVFQSAADVLMGRNTPGSMFYDNSGNSGVAVSRGNATMSTPGKGGNVNPMLVPVQNGFAGVQTGAGAVGAPNNVNLGLYNNSPYNGFQTPVTNGFTARNTFYQNVQAPFQTPPTNGFMAPAQTSGMLSGDKQGQVNSTTTAAGTPNLGQPPRPEGTYNPNNKDTAAQWKAYWNWEAANPQAAAAIALAEGRLSSAPVVMTREQIWQMKAAQRRKRAGTETPSYVSPVTSPTPYTGTGNFYSTILNTGSG
jgi:hypothetical protein